MSFSIIVDVINEERFTGKLTENLSKQDVFNYLNDFDLLKEVDVLKTGRNTIYKVSISSLDMHKYIDCAFKHFSKGGFLKCHRAWAKSSKAERTWINSLYLAEKSVGVAFPFLFVDMTNGEGVFISEYLNNRISFKDKLIDLLRNNPDINVISSLIKKIAFSIRLMHKAGFQHNDLGNQNILLREEDSGDVSSVEFIDLNRGRIRLELSDRQIARDLSRLTLPGELWELFENFYFIDKRKSLVYKLMLRIYVFLFSLHSKSRKFRHPVRERRIAKERAGQIGYPEKVVFKR